MNAFITDRSQTFLRLDAHVFEDPAVEELYGCGVLTWVTVLVLAKAGGYRGGIVPKAAVSPRRIARKYPACGSCGSSFPEAAAKHGLEQLAQQGLLVDHDTNHWLIPSWFNWQSDRPFTSTERSRRSRSKKKAERAVGTSGDGRDARDERDVAPSQRDAMQRGDGRDDYSNRLDTNRGEEEEEPGTPANGRKATVRRSSSGNSLNPGPRTTLSAALTAVGWKTKTEPTSAAMSALAALIEEADSPEALITGHPWFKTGIPDPAAFVSLMEASFPSVDLFPAFAESMRSQILGRGGKGYGGRQARGAAKWLEQGCGFAAKNSRGASSGAESASSDRFENDLYYAGLRQRTADKGAQA